MAQPGTSTYYSDQFGRLWKYQFSADGDDYYATFNGMDGDREIWVLSRPVPDPDWSPVETSVALEAIEAAKRRFADNQAGER